MRRYLPIVANIQPLPRRGFPMLGQSNMDGLGNLAQLPVFEFIHRVKIFSNAYQWIDGQEPADSPAGQVDEVSLSEQAAASCQVAFADRLSELIPGWENAVIPCSRGGTSADQWQMGADPYDRETLFGSAMYRAQVASERCTISGLIYYQGEYDAQFTGLASAWGGKVAQMIADMRTVLGAPNLPCIVTKLAPNETGRPGWATIQNAAEALDNGTDIRCVSASDLDLQGDGLHLTTASLVTLGRRYADTMFEMLEA